MPLTLSEFEASRRSLSCRHCRTVGELVTEQNPNNRGLQVVCLTCRRFDPIGDTPFLRKNGPRTQRPASRLGESLDEVWATWAHRCVGCGTSTAVLQRLGIGRHRQHAPPLATVDHDVTRTTLVPLCALCHEHVTANQRAIQALVSQLASVLGVKTEPGDRIDEAIP